MACLILSYHQVYSPALSPFCPAYYSSGSRHLFSGGEKQHEPSKQRCFRLHPVLSYHCICHDLWQLNRIFVRQVYIWDNKQQCWFADALRKVPLAEAETMPHKNTEMTVIKCNPRTILEIMSSLM